jgi:hypothetical protein
MPRLLIVVSLLVVLATSALAADGELTLTGDRVVVFKDGYCLVVKKAAGTSLADGTLSTEDVPDAAVLGSFWAVDPAGQLLSMSAGVRNSEVETEQQVSCRSYLEILKANTGKVVTVDLDNGEDVEGVIREVLGEEITVDVAPRRRSLLESSFRIDPSGRYETDQLVGDLFVLSTATKDSVIPVSRVKGVTGADLVLSAKTKVTEKRSAKQLTFSFAGGAAPREFSILYFRPGVRWIPTYRLGLDEPTHQARLSLQAEILNEAEDLVAVPFDLVVGVPNFRFKDVVSPFVLESALRNALARAAPQLMGQQSMGSNNLLSNSGFGARGGEWRGRDDGSPGEPGIDLPEDLTGGQSQDLYIYSRPELTQLKGHRAAVPVFETTTTYRDVYTFDLRLSRKDIEAAPSGEGASPLTLATNRIWHQIELDNDSKMPWTTGAAMILAGLSPLAQELLTYTPGGGTVRVPVTVAVNLRGTFEEEETGRRLDGLTWARQEYARIDKLGRLSVTNYMDHAIDLEITCRLGGHADSATNDGKITVGAFDKDDWENYLGHPAVNNSSVVTFRLTLQAGETVRPEVRFHYFARH